MAYESKALELIETWNRAYLLQEVPRDWEHFFEEDITQLCEAVRDDCSNVVQRWMDMVDGDGHEEIRPILASIHAEIKMRGIDGQYLPILRTAFGKTTRPKIVSDIDNG